MTLDLGLIIEAEALADYLDDECLLVVDVSIPQVYKEGHVPGAVHLAYPKIVFAHDDVDCDIPPDNVLGLALSEIGLLSDKHVVAYDSQNNPMASRLCWTLEEIGHEKFSLLNGGLNAWRDGGLAVEKKINTAAQSDYRVEQTGYCNATKEYILSKIGDPGVVILDTRMAEEFTNELLITDRGGNIPGAIHFDWMNNINQDDHFKLYGPDVLMANFRDIGVVPEKEIIVYCQTHFRSAHTYEALKSLGFENLKGYAAGYSEWGNAVDVPVENEFTEE